MPDDADLAARIAADLARVTWPPAEEIRRTARRRTRRSVLAAALSVLVLFSGVWVAATRPFQAAPEQTGFAAQPGPVPAPTTIGPGDPAWIPPEALLTPEDVGPGLIAAGASVDEGRPVGDWMFTFAPCRDLANTRPYEGVYRFRRQQTVEFPPKVPGRPDTGMPVLRQTVMRLSGGAARQLMSDAVSFAKACPKYVSDGSLAAVDGDRGGQVVKRLAVRTTHVWELLDSGFAGDESLLFEHRMTALTDTHSADLGASAVVVLRVGDLVATVEQVNGDNAATTRKLASRAAAWLCTAATPPC